MQGDAQSDGSAEWNLFWDAAAARQVIELHPELRVRMFSLDTTNSVPITDAFLRSFGTQYEHPLSAAAGCFYSLVAGHTHRTGDHYYAWDVLTAAFVLDPSMFAFDKRRVRVHTSGASRGRTEPDDDSVAKEVWVARPLKDPSVFYELVLKALK